MSTSKLICISLFLFSLSGCDLFESPPNPKRTAKPETKQNTTGGSVGMTEKDKNQAKVDIMSCFQRYKQAVLNDQGEQAVLCVDHNTLDYYLRCLELAKTAKKEAVKKLSLNDKMMVLFLRHRIPKETVLSMDEIDLFVYGVDHGMIGKDSTAGLQLGPITIEGDTATAKIITRGRVAPFGYRFVRRNGDWKLDLTSSFPAVEAAFKTLVQQQGLSDDEFILNTLEKVDPKKPDDSIWEPL